jgi:hypothetical protein
MTPILATPQSWSTSFVNNFKLVGGEGEGHQLFRSKEHSAKTPIEMAVVARRCLLNQF